MNRAWLFPVLVAAIAACAVAWLGMTITEVGGWYHRLLRPRWAPSDMAFAVGWTAILAITALAAVAGWRAMRSARELESLVGMIALNGFLAVLWSLLFFRLHRPDWAVIEILALWLAAGALILFVWRRSIGATLLLLPYLCWVTFAGYLTMTIVRLNGPFP